MTVGPETKSLQLPRVSIIIPTYNRSKLLRVALESALEQTYPNIEVIVVDDGSTDDTATVMAQYAGRVTYLKQANQDVAAARNTGIRAASGEYLTFLDDDDLILPIKIARQVQVLDFQPGVGLVHCQFYRANEDGNYLNQIGLLPEGEVLHKLVCRNFVWVGAPLIRRHCFDRVGLFDEGIPSITADWDMWLRIAQAGYRFACVQEPLGVYRIHRDSMLSDVVKLERGLFAVLEKVFSNPQLPADVAVLKKQALGEICFWIGCRYYAAGQWDDARRSLAAALALRPQLLRQPGRLLRFLRDDALSPRVRDPFQFVAGVFDHLPACADGLQRYRSHLLSQIYAGLAMRNYGAGNIAYAKSQLTEAIALDPTIFEQREDFVRLLIRHAVHLPLSAPVLYVDTVLKNLPAQAQRLGHVRARALSDVNIQLAYRDCLAGQRELAVRRIFTALRYRPFSIWNRRVVSTVLRLLLGLILGERGLRWVRGTRLPIKVFSDHPHPQLVKAAAGGGGGHTGANRPEYRGYRG
jgi:glycosyltransferase involved in cell wall biosynthesis